MKYKKSIRDINGFFLKNDSFFTLFNQCINKYNDSFDILWEIEVPGVTTKYHIYNDYVYLEYIEKSSGFERTSLVDIKAGKIVENEIGRYMIRSISDNGRAISLRYNPDYSVTTYCIQLPFGDEIWEAKLTELPLFIDRDILVGSGKDVISLLNSSGSVVWKYITSTLGDWNDYNGNRKQTQVSRNLGVYENQLFSLLNNGRILVLDLESGAKVDLLENNKNTDQGSFSGMFMNAIELDQVNGKLILLFNQRYTEVDLSTGGVTQIHLDEMKENGLENMNRFIFDDAYIFFSDQYHQKIASLNRDTLKIDWIHDLSDGTGTHRYARDLKLSGNRLFALDNKNTLHVFEQS
jgi:hypothetical protein